MIFVADGELLFGEAAERRGLAQPERLVREFKRRIGDDVPIVVGDQRFAPEELYARMVAWVVDAVAEREGCQPSAICVTTPVTWGAYRSALVAAALAREVSSPVELITEPEAAARHYETTSPLETGQAIAVYDLGGGTFDAVLLRKEEDGAVRPIGEPTGLADFGGADFDDIVLRHVLAAAGLVRSRPRRRRRSLAWGSPRSGASASRRRRRSRSTRKPSCRCSSGRSSTTVRITRAEFEGMIEEGVERTIDVLEASLDAAGMEPADLEAILLTGGSSRIPRISQLLSERFDRPIAIDADPKAIVALGAARELGDRRDAAEAATAAALSSGLGARAAIAVADGAAVTPPPPAPAPRHPASDTAKRRRFGRVPVTAAIAGGAMVLAGGIVFATASELGSSAVSDAGPAAELTTDWLGLPLANSSAASDPAAQAAPPAVGEAVAPQTDSPRSLKAPTTHSKKPSSAKETTRTATASPTEDARPSRIPDADAPRPEASTPPSSPPADPEPSDDPTPSDPTPSDPPSDPTPSDPPSRPDTQRPAGRPDTQRPAASTRHPATRRVDPTPSDPPVDPTPSDPPVDPTPSDPPVDPTPSDPPPPEPEPTP